MTRLGVDVGGTFTDLVALSHDGDVRVVKVPSTPEDSSVGLWRAVDLLAEQGGARRMEALIHGTTVATNALLERRAGDVTFLVTAGFEDLLWLRRQDRAALYDLARDHPPPLVGQHSVIGVGERIGAAGVVRPLTDWEVERVVRETSARRPTAVAICLLFSFADPSHERRLALSLRAALPGTPIVASHELLPVFREYERASTTTVEAYLRPLVGAYIERVGREAAGRGIGDFRVMASHGGTLSAAQAKDRASALALSGPVGGVEGARLLGLQVDRADLLTIDMGGTSADASLILGGEPLVQSSGPVGGIPVALPHVVIETVGAGGGSIAWVDQGGALRVGPRSAGAVPGPACYGKGGDRPTVTDANVVLGRLPPRLLGGKMVLDTKAAEEAVGKIARSLSLDLHQAAQGILDIVNENMFGALRLVTVQKGLDPRDFALVAFGGAGPMHGNAMAMLAGCYPAIVPPTPGVLSALGFLYSDVKNEFAQTFVRNIDDADLGQVGEILARLGREARVWLREEGIEEGRQRLRYEADVRYFRQGYEFSLEIDPDRLGSGGLNDLAGRFGLAHERIYGFKLDQPVELVNLRAVGVGAVQKIDLPKFEKEGADAAAAVIEQHRAYFDGSFSSVNVYDRTRLRRFTALPT